MMNIVNLAKHSISSRKSTLILTIFSISMSLLLLLSIERIRLDIKHSFANTISGTDLIVGARTGSAELLLQSIFRIGHANNTMSWHSYEKIQSIHGIKWTVPISLGDSHKGLSVIGTTADYFKYYKFADKQALSFAFGNSFEQSQQVVLGANVAKKLNYVVGDELVISHGTGNTSFHHHEKHPFRVIGILNPTGTPVDNGLHIPISDVELIHNKTIAHDEHHNHDHDHGHDHKNSQTTQPKQITAVLIGLKSPVLALQIQARINRNNEEPLSAILPKYTLKQIWQIVSPFEKTLILMSLSVLIVSLIGMLALILNTLSQRTKELTILRSVGASPRYIFALICLETLFIVLISICVSIFTYFLLFTLLAPALQANFALTIQLSWLSASQMQLIGITLFLSLLLAMLPAFRAYQRVLSIGLSNK